MRCLMFQEEIYTAEPSSGQDGKGEEGRTGRGQRLVDATLWREKLSHCLSTETLAVSVFLYL